MVEVTFFDVGQGDSIIIKWERDGKMYHGIIDSKEEDNINPVLDYLKYNGIQEIEFLIISHMHLDHYSGISEILKHCIQSNISINLFLHTFEQQMIELFDLIYLSQKKSRQISRFFKTFEDAINQNLIKEIDSITHNFSPIELNSKIWLRFLSPNGRDKIQIAKGVSRLKNKDTTTIPDLNILSTIVEIFDSENCILLTADASKNNFERIKSKVKSKVLLVQAPHHGSLKNLHEEFWTNLNIRDNCPALFSVGDEPKDKLPNFEVVDFFFKNGFDIYSTNEVYGISEYLKRKISSISPISIALNSHALPHKATSSVVKVNNKYNGNKTFTIPLGV